VTQLLPQDHIADVRRETQQRLLQSGFLNSLKPEAQVAITAGSRGMGGFVELLAGIVDAVKAKGGRPFLIPAMGSHGGATEEGQTEILRRLGVTDGPRGNRSGALLFSGFPTATRVPHQEYGDAE
jgi:hypothetical protein